MDLLRSRRFSLGKEGGCEHVIKHNGNRCFRSPAYRLMCTARGHRDVEHGLCIQQQQTVRGGEGRAS